MPSHAGLEEKMHKKLIEDVINTRAEFGARQVWFTKSDVMELMQEALNCKQAEIDSLMLEFCPEDMTEEQLDNWESHQIPISDERYNEVCRTLGFPTK